jgi:CRISPR/Cas system-associated exonuclease Cas4 (RecB family)
MPRSVIKGLKLKSKDGRLNPTDIAQAIEKGLLAQGRPSQDFTQKKTFSPSSIGYGHGTCPRFWFIAFNGTENWQDNVDAMGIANMGVGSMVHEYIQTALKSSGFLVEEELEIKLQDPPVRGYLDAIVEWNGEELVCEIKTTRQETFFSKEVSGKPSPNHLIQILLYLKATEKKRGFLLYVNKNDQSLLVIPVEMDEANAELLEKVLGWLRITREAYDNDTLPMIPFTRARTAGEPTNNICRQCPVQKDCFGKYPAGVVDLPLMEVPAL